jgi:hypothetical protein
VQLPLKDSNLYSPDPESDASPRLTGTNAQKSVEIAQIRAGSPTIPPTIPHRPKPFATGRRRVVSPEGRLRIALAQRTRRPMNLERRCESLAPAEGHTAVFQPYAPNQKRCRACCRADKYNLAKNKATRQLARARRVA